MIKYATSTGSLLTFVCISSLISTADRVKHVLPQAHLRLPGVAPTQLVPDSPHRSHHSTHGAVSSGKKNKSFLTQIVLVLLFIGLLTHPHLFYSLLTDNIMHT